MTAQRLADDTFAALPSNEYPSCCYTPGLWHSWLEEMHLYNYLWKWQLFQATGRSYEPAASLRDRIRPSQAASISPDTPTNGVRRGRRKTT